MFVKIKVVLSDMFTMRSSFKYLTLQMEKEVLYVKDSLFFKTHYFLSLKIRY